MFLLCVDMPTIHKGTVMLGRLMSADLIDVTTVGNVRQLSSALTLSALDLIPDQVESIHFVSPVSG